MNTPPLLPPFAPVNTSPPESRVSINVRIMNLAPEDREFLRDIIALMCDPWMKPHRDQLRAGAITIAHGPGGHARMCPLHKSN